MSTVMRATLWFVALLVLPLGACARPRAERAAPVAQAEPPTGAAKAAEAAQPADDANRKLIIREATLKLRTASPRNVIQASTELARRYEGFVVKSETSAVGESALQADVTLRVRADHLDAALAELRKLGDVLSESISGQDVTAEFVDVQARLKAKQVLEQRLLGIAAAASKVEDTLKVETELSRVRSEIEQLEGRSKYLEERARLSLIHVTAVSPNQTTEPRAESFASKMHGAFGRGKEVAVELLAALVVLAGFFLPLLVLAALFVLPLAFWWRRRRRRAAAAAGQPGPS
jgi:hypothetical protein